MNDVANGSHASNDQAQPSKAAVRNRRRPARPTLAATLALVSAGIAALFAAGSVWLHAVGLAYQGAYLGQYSVPTGMFPAGAADLMYLGYLALLERGIWATTSWIAQPSSWLSLIVAYAYLRLLRWMLPAVVNPESGLPKWMAWSIREILLPAFYLAGLLLVLLLTILFLWGVISPGHFAGLRQAEKELASTESICSRCLTIETETGTVIGRLLAATTADVAIYVPAERRTHVIARAEITAMTTTLSSSAADRASAKHDAPSQPQ